MPREMSSFKTERAEVLVPGLFLFGTQMTQGIFSGCCGTLEMNFTEVLEGFTTLTMVYYNSSYCWKAKITTAAVTMLSKQPWTTILRSISTDVGTLPWGMMELVDLKIRDASLKLPEDLDRFVFCRPQLKSSLPSQVSSEEPKQVMQTQTISSSIPSDTIYFYAITTSIARFRLLCRLGKKYWKRAHI